MADKAPNAAPKATVLCAEDDPALLRVIAKQVERQGFRALTAVDGRAALEVALREKPDLILSDWMMPHMDGVELCRKVRESEDLKSTYFIILTAKEGTDNLVQALDAGADDYLTKPFQHGELLARIRSGVRVVGLHRQLAESQRALFRAEKLASLGIMAGGVAHEFNNIFGAIVGYCELALEQKDPGRTEKALRVTLESAERATAITRNLLGFAREQPPSLRPVDMVQCLDNVLDIVNVGLRKRNISVARIVDQVGPAKGDAAQIQQVLFNIIQNAEHAMESGGQLTITIRPADGGSGAEVSVTDTGIGIAPENLPRVFEPFFTTKGAYGGGAARGTGLGLSVVHGIVKAHGGSVTIQSVPGQGTVVTVKIPAWTGEAPPTAEPAPRPAEEVAQALPPGERLAILAVDDEPRILEVIKDMLEGFGHSVQTASSAEQAVKMFNIRSYDLVFADVIMPGKNGWELLAEFRAIRPHTAVIFVTGSIGKDTFKKAQEVGAFGCIYKPFHLQDIRRVLADFTASRERRPIIVRLMPEMDRDKCDALLAMVTARLAESPRDLELDMANVGYLPSHALGCLMAIRGELSGTGRKLILSNVSEHTFEVLDLAGLAGGYFDNLIVRRRVYDGHGR